MNADSHVARDSREERGAARVSFSTYSRQFGGEGAIRGGCCCGNLLSVPMQSTWTVASGRDERQKARADRDRLNKRSGINVL